MIAFILGIISGLIISLSIDLIVLFVLHKKGYEKASDIWKEVESLTGIKPKRGAIYMPQSDIEEARDEIIRKNREAGIDTPVSDLIENEE